MISFFSEQIQRQYRVVAYMRTQNYSSLCQFLWLWKNHAYCVNWFAVILAELRKQQLNQCIERNRKKQEKYKSIYFCTYLKIWLFQKMIFILKYTVTSRFQPKLSIDILIGNWKNEGNCLIKKYRKNLSIPKIEVIKLQFRFLMLQTTSKTWTVHMSTRKMCNSWKSVKLKKVWEILLFSLHN